MSNPTSRQCASCGVPPTFEERADDEAIYVRTRCKCGVSNPVRVEFSEFHARLYAYEQARGDWNKAQRLAQEALPLATTHRLVKI